MEATISPLVYSITRSIKQTVYDMISELLEKESEFNRALRSAFARNQLPNVYVTYYGFSGVCDFRFRPIPLEPFGLGLPTVVTGPHQNTDQGCGMCASACYIVSCEQLTRLSLP